MGGRRSSLAMILTLVFAPVAACIVAGLVTGLVGLVFTIGSPKGDLGAIFLASGFVAYVSALVAIPVTLVFGAPMHLLFQILGINKRTPYIVAGIGCAIVLTIGYALLEPNAIGNLQWPVIATLIWECRLAH